MTSKLVYIIVVLIITSSCESNVDYNSLSKTNLNNYRYKEISTNSEVHYNFTKSTVRYNLNNNSQGFSSRGGVNKYKQPWQSYIKDDKNYSEYSDHPDYSDYSEKNYSLYRKPRNYTGYYKVGNPYEVLGQKYCPMENPDYRETGVASWYGEEFYGKQTANGETYNMHDLTAAHRTLPLPSVVRVTNLDNGRSIKVRVNDRGPFTKDRIIDVSKEAAQKLGFINYGTTRVKVEYLNEDTEKMLRNFGLK